MRQTSLWNRLFAAAAVALITLVSSASLHAQPAVVEDPDVRTLFSKIVNPFVNANERPEDVRAKAEAFVVGIRNGLTLGLTTVPLGTGSAGFAYVRDAATGEQLLKSNSFGPVFLDRPLTSGKGQFGIGFHYQHMSFDKLQGIDVREQGLIVESNDVLFLRDGFHQYSRGVTLLDATGSMFVVNGSFGVTDALDIGVVVPILSLDVNAQRVNDYDYTYDYQDIPSLRALVPAPAGRIINDRRHASATGVGDIGIRVKYAFGQGSTQPVAAAFDLRLPTGNEDNLLGSGKVGGRVQLLGTQRIGSFMNVYGQGGYTFNTISDQINYGAAVDVVLLPRKQLTVAFDLLGQTLMDNVSGIETSPAYPTGDTILPGLEFRGVRRTSYDRYFFQIGRVNILTAGIGAKYHVGGNVLLTGSVSIPLNDQGFRTGVTPFVGIEKTWVR
jgi:hypothetical protein